MVTRIGFFELTWRRFLYAAPTAEVGISAPPRGLRLSLVVTVTLPFSYCDYALAGIRNPGLYP